MIYWIIRCILGAIIFTIAFIFIKKSHITNKKLLYAVSFIIASILVSLMYFIPIENMFITFSSPEKAFNYTSSWKIQHIIYGSETDLVIASKGTTNTYKILPKTTKGWKLSTGLETEKYALFYKGTSIDIYRHKNTNDYYMILFNTDGETIEINDSLNSHFSVINKTDVESSKQVYYCTVVKNLGDDYTLNLNGEEVKIKQDMLKIR